MCSVSSFAMLFRPFSSLDSTSAFFFLLACLCASFVSSHFVPSCSLAHLHLVHMVFIYRSTSCALLCV
ncbi:hypothetical protein BCR44DRAFT_1429773, partial [Catenaria anguillulae PL171]